MRLEDKELEGPELEREQRLEVLEEQSEEHDHELPLASESIVDVELEHRSRLFDALQLILAGEHLDIALLYLPQRETLALEALQSAVTGKNQRMGTFVLAEDRGSLLEQALAILQQNLTQGDAATLAALETKYEQLTSDVAELRDHLLDLEDAQDDLIVHEQDKARRPAPTDTDEEEADESVTGFIASALQALAVVAGTDVNTLRSTLDGPELPDTPPRPSTLSGEERVPLAKPASALVGVGARGPEATLPDHVSTLDGPEANRPEYVSTLHGTERPERPDSEKRSTLYTDGMSKLIVPPERRSSPTIDPGSPPVRKSSPTIDPPRNRFPSVPPPNRTSTPPHGTAPLARTSSPSITPPAHGGMTPIPKPGEKPTQAPVEKAAGKPAEAPRTSEAPRRGLSLRSSDRPTEKAEPAPDPTAEPAKPEPRRGLSVRSTDKPKDKK